MEARGRRIRLWELIARREILIEYKENSSCFS